MLHAGEADIAASHLVFGCRSQHADFYYKGLWQELMHAGVLARDNGLITAFSRDQKQKVYVQDQLKQHSSLIWQQLEKVCLALASGMLWCEPTLLYVVELGCLAGLCQVLCSESQ